MRGDEYAWWYVCAHVVVEVGGGEACSMGCTLCPLPVRPAVWRFARALFSGGADDAAVCRHARWPVCLMLARPTSLREPRFALGAQKVFRGRRRRETTSVFAKDTMLRYSIRMQY